MNSPEVALFEDEVALVLFPDKSVQLLVKDSLGNSYSVELSEKQWGILTNFVRKMT